MQLGCFLKNTGNSVVVQWLGLGAITAGAPGQGTKILPAVQRSQQPKNKKQKDLEAGTV